MRKFPLCVKYVDGTNLTRVLVKHITKWNIVDKAWNSLHLLNIFLRTSRVLWWSKACSRDPVLCIRATWRPECACGAYIQYVWATHAYEWWTGCIQLYHPGATKWNHNGKLSVCLSVSLLIFYKFQNSWVPVVLYFSQPYVCK
jgi:hypothetical protein